MWRVGGSVDGSGSHPCQAGRRGAAGASHSAAKPNHSPEKSSSSAAKQSQSHPRAKNGQVAHFAGWHVARGLELVALTSLPQPSAAFPTTRGSMICRAFSLGLPSTVTPGWGTISLDCERQRRFTTGPSACIIPRTDTRMSCSFEVQHSAMDCCV